MKPASTARHARAFVAVAASRGRADEAAASLGRAARFFASGEGRMAVAVLQSPRVPPGERAGFLDDVASSLGLVDEAKALLADFARMRALGALGAVASRARELAAAEAGRADAELRTAGPLSPGAVDRIRSAVERVLGRSVRLAVVEDASLLGGVVLRAGNSVWDGSLAGRLARAAEALARQ